MILMNPNALSFSRFFLGLFMVISALNNSIFLFLLFYMLSIASDVLDGYLARKLKKVTEFGKKLDITADKVIVLCAFLSLFLLGKLRDIRIFLLVYAYYFVSQMISLMMHKKTIFIRNIPSNIAAVIFPIVVFSMLFYYIPLITYIYAIIMFYSTTNKIFITINSKNKVAFFLVFVLASGMILIMPKDKKACFEGKCISLDVADNDSKRALGLMFKESLSEDEGMLFTFEKPGYYKFYMKNMNFPIDIIFLDESFRIITIYADVPPCTSEPCELYPPDAPSRYVIETKANFTRRYGIFAEERVSIV